MAHRHSAHNDWPRQRKTLSVGLSGFLPRDFGAFLARFRKAYRDCLLSALHDPVRVVLRKKSVRDEFVKFDGRGLSD